MTTIFTRIIEREIPAHIIYEDDVVMAFLDIHPIQPGHTLVVPKVPFVNAFDGHEDTLAHMMRIGARIANAQKHHVPCDGVNLIMNNGEAAGQEVFHAHLHVIPRMMHDGAFVKPNRTEYTAPEAVRIQELLASALAS
jgi:histidine triad (HIT) family protein